MENVLGEVGSGFKVTFFFFLPFSSHHLCTWMCGWIAGECRAVHSCYNLGHSMASAFVLNLKHKLPRHPGENPRGQEEAEWECPKLKNCPTTQSASICDRVYVTRCGSRCLKDPVTPHSPFDGSHSRCRQLSISERGSTVGSGWGLKGLAQDASLRSLWEATKTTYGCWI